MMKFTVQLSVATILLIVIITQSNCDDNKTINGPTVNGSQTSSSQVSTTPRNEEEMDDGALLKKEFQEEDKAANKTDNHQFYKPEFISDPVQAMSYWVDFSKLPGNTSTKHEMLSKSHRRAAPVRLSFDFPFYGHPIKSVIIATGGFLYVGDHLHHWLAATQNISPLMANFDLSLTNYSDLHHYDNHTSFVVQWQDVQLKDNNPPGNFSFQVTLHKNGDIIFVYKHLAYNISSIPEEDHPVKVGISDAFLIDNVAYFIRRKTIFDYHRINMKNDFSFKNQTAIYLRALPTCNQYDTCESCARANPSMECIWCPAVKRCSNGLDRKRQEWIQKECTKITKSDCSAKTEPSVQTEKPEQSLEQPTINEQGMNARQGGLPDSLVVETKEKGGGAALLSLLIFVAMSAGLGFWVIHAYKNPHTQSGQLLIKYRPSNWRWQVPETRYTAASIHM